MHGLATHLRHRSSDATPPAVEVCIGCIVQQMRRRDYFLLAGALAAGLQGVDKRMLNPVIANLLVCLGLGLAWFSQRPRHEHERHEDHP